MIALKGREFFLGRYAEFGCSLTGDEAARQAIRVNPLRASDADVVGALSAEGVQLEKVPWLDHGYWVAGSPFSLGASLEYLLGLYSIQEAASQLPVQVLRPGPLDVALDMCSAPGGKTTQMAAYMGDGGVLYAVDASRERLYAAENNLERCGVTNTLVYRGDAATIDLRTRFTKILLDAPCSGNYAADPGWFSRRTLRDVEINAERQRVLLSRAVGLLETGGRLLYSTCSLEPEEDELNVQWLLENYPVDLLSVTGPGAPASTEVLGVSLDPRVSRCRRIWPGEGTQGFFIAEAVRL